MGEAAGPAPGEMSVVVAAFSGEAALERCLRSLEPQWTGVEVIAATFLDRASVDRLATRFPAVRFLAGPAAASVFRLRALGVAEARGRLVALTEDHCTVAPVWIEALRTAFRAGHRIVGGPVENGLTSRAYDWALYLCEYGAHMPPLPEGPADILSGLNVAYDRDLLMGCRETWREAFHENEVHDALGPALARLHRAEKAVVVSHLDMPLGKAAAHLFHGARRYGRHRKSVSSSRSGWLLALAAPVLPGLLVWRELRHVAARRPRSMGKTLRGLPYLTGLICAWSAGEAAGYLAPGPRRPRD